MQAFKGLNSPEFSHSLGVLKTKLKVLQVETGV